MIDGGLVRPVERAPARASGASRFVQAIERLIGPHRSIPRVAVHGACLTLIPAAAMGALLFATLQALGVDPAAAARDDLTFSVDDLIGTVLVAPPIETLMLAGLLRLLAPLGSKFRIALVSGILWGLLHALLAWGAFLTAWPFFVFSVAWLAHRPQGFGHAFIAVTAIHALHNAALFLTLGAAA